MLLTLTTTRGLGAARPWSDTEIPSKEQFAAFLEENTDVLSARSKVNKSAHKRVDAADEQRWQSLEQALDAYLGSQEGLERIDGFQAEIDAFEEQHEIATLDSDVRSALAESRAALQLWYQKAWAASLDRRHMRRDFVSLEKHLEALADAARESGEPLERLREIHSAAELHDSVREALEEAAQLHSEYLFIADAQLDDALESDRKQLAGARAAEHYKAIINAYDANRSTLDEWASKDGFSFVDHSEFFVYAMVDAGWTWGGGFGDPDFMHFEYEFPGAKKA